MSVAVRIENQPFAGPPGLRAWWWLPLVWVLLGMVLSLQPWVWGHMEWESAVRFGAVEWGPWLLLAPAAVWLSLRLPLAGAKWKRSLAVHVAASLATAVTLEAIAVRTGLGVRPPPPEMREPGRPNPPPPAPGPRAGRPPRPFFMRLRLTVPLYWLLVAAAQVIHYHHAARERERRATRAEAQLIEARLAALQMQLQPHFLFNCLNSISSLVHAQPEVADEMLCALSGLLRAALASAGQREVTLAEELELADAYLLIQQIRFDDTLVIERRIEPGTAGAAVPPLLLQPLLENAVVHGLAGRGGTLELQVGRTKDRLRLRVTDRATVITPSRPVPGTGIGLGNIRARLATLYGSDYKFALIPVTGGTCAEVELPWRVRNNFSESLSATQA